jgi:hypothetical protein
VQPLRPLEERRRLASPCRPVPRRGPKVGPFFGPVSGPRVLVSSLPGGPETGPESGPVFGPARRASTWPRVCSGPPPAAQRPPVADPLARAAGASVPASAVENGAPRCAAPSDSAADGGGSRERAGPGRATASADATPMPTAAWTPRRHGRWPPRATAPRAPRRASAPHGGRRGASAPPPPPRPRPLARPATRPRRPRRPGQRRARPPCRTHGARRRAGPLALPPPCCHPDQG